MKLPRIVDVEEAIFTAVAYEENGDIVVEVSDRLKGRERATVIMAAVRAHKHGLGSIVLLPAALYLWEPIKAAARKHPAATLASTAVIVAIAGAAVAATGLRDTGNDTPMATPPAHTLVATITAIPTSAATAKTQRPRITPKPTRTRPSSAAGNPQAKPTSRPEPSRRTQPAPSPTASRRPTTGTTPTVAAQPASSPKPTPRSSAIDTPGTAALGADMKPAPAHSTTPPPASTQNAAPAPSETEPAAMSSAGPSCFVEIDLDPLLDLCLR